MKAGFLDHLRDQYRRVPEVSTFAVDLTGKVIVVTGANVGLGYEAAKHLATMKPAKLILACRDMKKGDQAARDLATATGCKTVVCWKVDQSDSASVKAFAEQFDQEGGGKLDILIANAGVSKFTFERTSAGWEQTVATNHLGTVHLTLRLLPFLLKADKPRVVVVSSETHYWVKQPEEADTEGVLQKLNDESRKKKFYAIMNRYYLTKMFNILFVRTLAARLPASSSLTINAVNPGLCYSSLLRDLNPIPRAMLRSIARTTEVGSRTLVHAAIAKSMDGTTGEYLNVCKVTEPSDFVVSKRGASAAERLWTDTLAVLSEGDDSVREIAKQCLN